MDRTSCEGVSEIWQLRKSLQVSRARCTDSLRSAPCFLPLFSIFYGTNYRFSTFDPFVLHSTTPSLFAPLDSDDFLRQNRPLSIRNYLLQIFPIRPHLSTCHTRLFISHSFATHPSIFAAFTHSRPSPPLRKLSTPISFDPSLVTLC